MTPVEALEGSSEPILGVVFTTLLVFTFTTLPGANVFPGG